MSTPIYIAPGQTVTKDPAAERIYQFDWDALLATSVEIAGTPTVTIVALNGEGAALLTSDNVAKATGNRKVNVRIKAGTVGATYSVTCQIVTNESPTQTEERTFFVRVAQE